MSQGKILNMDWRGNDPKPVLLEITLLFNSLERVVVPGEASENGQIEEMY